MHWCDWSRESCLREGEGDGLLFSSPFIFPFHVRTETKLFFIFWYPNLPKLNSELFDSNGIEFRGLFTELGNYGQSYLLLSWNSDIAASDSFGTSMCNQSSWTHLLLMPSFSTLCAGLSFSSGVGCFSIFFSSFRVLDTKVDLSGWLMMLSWS